MINKHFFIETEVKNFNNIHILLFQEFMKIIFNLINTIEIKINIQYILLITLIMKIENSYFFMNLMKIQILTVIGEFNKINILEEFKKYWILNDKNLIVFSWNLYFTRIECLLLRKFII